MKWIIFSKDQLGDDGLSGILNLSNGDVLISYTMATHTRNVVFDPQIGTFKRIRNGKVETTNDPERPLLIKDSKGYFANVGGAYWVDLQLDSMGNIRFIGSSFSSECISKSEFINRTDYTNEDLKFTINSEVCFSR